MSQFKLAHFRKDAPGYQLRVTVPGVPREYLASLWRHNGRDCVSNYQRDECLLNRSFRRRSKNTSKLRIAGLSAGIHRWPVNSPHKCQLTRKIFPFDDVFMRGDKRNPRLKIHNFMDDSWITPIESPLSGDHFCWSSHADYILITKVVCDIVEATRFLYVMVRYWYSL